jgi:hypothetical protein
VLHEEARKGWEFYRVESVDVKVKPFAVESERLAFSVIVFRRKP